MINVWGGKIHPKYMFLTIGVLIAFTLANFVIDFGENIFIGVMVVFFLVGIVFLRAAMYQSKQAYLGIDERSLDAYNNAIEHDSDDAVAWKNKGYVLLKRGRYEEAIQACDNAIELKPENTVAADAWDTKGDALSQLGRYEEAIQACDNAMKLKPDDDITWHHKGFALANLGRYDEALEAYDKVTELDPKDATAWNCKGSALANLRRYNEALEAYNKAIELDPKDATAKANKKKALKMLGRER